MCELNYPVLTTIYRLRSSSQDNPTRIIWVHVSPRSTTTRAVSIGAPAPGYRKIGNFQHNLQGYETVKPGDVIHGHDHYTEPLKDALKLHEVGFILTMRDPRDQVVSRLFHIRRTPNHAWQTQLQNMSNDEGLMACINGLDPKTFPGVIAHSNITKSWLTNYPEGVVVRYEDLLADTEQSMASIFSRLEIDVPETVLKLIVHRKNFQRMTAGRKFWQQGRKPGTEAPTSHLRKGITGDWKNHFKPEHVQRFKELAGNFLIEWGYEKDLKWQNTG